MTETPVQLPVSETLNLPERIEGYKNQTKITHLGHHLTFASNHFAQPLDNEEAEIRFRVQQEIGPMTRLTAKRFRRTGVKVRFESPSLAGETTPEKLHEEYIAAGALLVRQAMEARGLTDIKFLKVGSALLDDTAKEIAKKAGLDTENLHIKDYHTACADFPTMLIDALYDPELQGEDGIILNLNPISALQQERHFDDQLEVGLTFGDANIATAFNTGDFEPIAAQIAIVPDGGLIMIDKFYEVNEFDESKVPEHLRGIIKHKDKHNQNGTQIAEITDSRFALALSRPDEDDLMAKMNGEETAKHFIEIMQEPIIDVLEKAEEIVPNIHISQNIIHDPGFVVAMGFQRGFRFNKSAKERLRPELIRDATRIGFLLNEMDESNSSGSTTPMKWQYLAEQGETPEGYFLLAAPGIGSAMSVLVAKFIYPRGEELLAA